MRRCSLVLTALWCAATAELPAQARIVTGRVIDSLTAQPLGGVRLTLKGTTTRAFGKQDGTFAFAVPPRDVVLVAQLIGYKKREARVPAGQDTVTMALARDVFQVEAVVVTGQATSVERRNVANAVSVLNPDQLARVPIASIQQDMSGKIAGAQISKSSGAPGGGDIVRLRGVTSIIGTFTPLYVVDGVIVSDAAIGTGTNLVRVAFRSAGIVPQVDNQDDPVNRVGDLNPEDIESVEVLKGATASAIYGSKASNGVIVITTKRGQVGAPRFTLTQRLGFAALSKKYGTRCFNSADEAAAVFGAQARTDFQPGVCHDFEDELYGGRPLSDETSGTVSGGTETTRYFSSLLVKHDGGIVPNTFADKQSLRLSIDQSVGKGLSLSVAGDVLHTAGDRGLFNNENNGSPPQAALSSMPSFIDFRARCPDGSIATDPANVCDGATWPSTAPYAFSNPFQTVALFKNRESVWRSIVSGRVSWDAVATPVHTLRFLATGGGDIFTQKNQVFSSPELQFEQLAGLPGTSVIGYAQSQNFNVNGNIVHQYNAGVGTATSQVGVQFESADLDRTNTLNRNLVGGQPNAGSGTVSQVEEYRERVRDLGFFAQEEFLTLGERLLLTTGVRADRSSNNAYSHRLFFFPKGSASYRISAGGALLSELKLRAAFGESGNRPTYGQKFTNLLPGNILGLPTAQISDVTAAADLRPERQQEVEGGFDATLLGGRAQLEATVYQKRISDLLLTRTLTPTEGFTQLIFNGGVIRNRGAEASLGVLPVQRPDFQWDLRGTFSLNRCKVSSLPVSTFQPIGFFNFLQFGTTQIEVGKSCTQVIAQDTLGAVPGDSGSPGTVVFRPIGDNSPDWRASVSSELTYKRLKVYFLWDGQHGGLITNFSLFTYDCVGTSVDEVTAASPGALTGQQRCASKSGRTITTSASYLKLREAGVSFEVPESVVHRFWSGARLVRLSVSGRNLLTFTPYRGYDPEVQQVARSLAAETSWELWTYPSSRTFFFSVETGF